jgi:hypothetical protein
VPGVIAGGVITAGVVAAEIPKVLFAWSKTNAPRLSTAIERAVANEPTAIAKDPVLEENPHLRSFNSQGIFASLAGLGI